MSQALRQDRISYAFYPHIVETILSYCDYSTLLRFRATCKSLKTRAHRALHDDHLAIDVEGSFIYLSFFTDESDPSQPPPPPREAPTVVLRSSLGVLPFRTEADWTWACEHSHTVEIDGAYLSASTHNVPHATRGFSVRQPGPDSREMWPRRALPSTAESVAIQTSLLSALTHIPRTASATITHSHQHGPPAYLPPAEDLILRGDPLCECPPVTPEHQQDPQPLHSAKHITLRIPDAWDGVDHMVCCCNLSYALLQPSVERLTLSINRTMRSLHPFDFGFVLYALEGRCHRRNIKRVEIELRPTKPRKGDETVAEQIKMEWDRYCHVTSDEVHFLYSDTAGDPRPYTRPF